MSLHKNYLNNFCISMMTITVKAKTWNGIKYTLLEQKSGTTRTNKTFDYGTIREYNKPYLQTYKTELIYILCKMKSLLPRKKQHYNYTSLLFSSLAGFNKPSISFSREEFESSSSALTHFCTQIMQLSHPMQTIITIHGEIPIQCRAQNLSPRALDLSS